MFSSIPLQIPSGFVSQKPKYCRGKFTEEYDLDKEDKSSFSSLSLSLSSSWLTGIRVDVPHDQFACRNGFEYMFAFIKICSDLPTLPEFEWVQPVNVLQSFPWPILAGMATTLHFRVEISLAYPENAPINVGVSTAFYNLTSLPVGESYIFTNVLGQPKFAWNSLQEHCYDSSTGTDKLCRVVPSSSQLFEWREQLLCWT